LLVGAAAVAAAFVVVAFAAEAFADEAPKLTSAGSVTTQNTESTVTLTCPRGYVATGVSADLSGFEGVTLSGMWPAGRYAYARATATRPVSAPWTLRAQAVCVRQTADIEYAVMTTSATVPAQAPCPRNKELIGLGWAATGGSRIMFVVPTFGSGGVPPVTGTGGFPGTGTGGFPTGTGGFPTGTGGFPTGTGGFPTGTGGFPTGTGGFPTGTGGFPTGTGGFPTGTGGFPTGTGGFPTGTGGFPTGTGGFPTGTGGFPTGTGGFPTGTGGFPTGTGGFPTGTGGPTPGQHYNGVVAGAIVAPGQEHSAGLSVAAVCAFPGHGTRIVVAPTRPRHGGTAEATATCPGGAYAQAAGLRLGPAGNSVSEVRSLTVNPSRRSGRLVITDRNRPGGGELLLLCAR
jgi:hypothetical protein